MAPFIGYFAAFMGAICWIPQMLKAWRSRDTKALSLPTNLMFLATVTLWLIYGLMVWDMPIIVANIFAVAAMTSIVVAKLRFG
jgi:MtN3 and saliva related transmembrane protein